MENGIGKLNLKDLVKGGVSALIAGVVIALAGAMGGDFNVFTANWGQVLTSAINAGISAFIGYIGKNLLTTTDGKFLGKV